MVSKQASAATFDWSSGPGAPRPAAASGSRSVRLSATQTGPRDVSHLAGWVAAQQEGNRNEGLFWAANRAVEAGDTETLGQLAQAARDAGLDDREIDRTIRSAQQTSAGTRPFAREKATAGQRVPSPRADVDRATAAATTAARSHKEAEHEREPGA